MTGVLPMPTPEQIELGWRIFKKLKETINFLKKKENKEKVIEFEDRLNPKLVQHVLPEEIVIIELDGRTYLVSKKNTSELIFEYIRKQKLEEERLKKEIELIKRDFVNEVDEVKEYVSEEEHNIPPEMNEENGSLLLLSQYAKEAYDRGNKKLGDRRKAEIGQIYGPHGNLFCNLYSQGYLITALEHFDWLVKNKLIEAKKINEFLDFVIKYWDNVFFIHHAMDMDKVYEMAVYSISNSKEYVAFHGIGFSNVDKINSLYEKLIMEEIKTLEKNKYAIKIKPGKVKGDYPKKDVYFFTPSGKIVYEKYQKL